MVPGSVTQTGLEDFGDLGGLFWDRRYRFIEFIGVVHMVRPPPSEPVELSWEEVDELYDLAIGRHFVSGE